MPSSRLMPPNTPKFISENMSKSKALVEMDKYIRPPMVVILVIYIVLMFIILDYIRKLEQTGCVCSTDWRRDFISWYVIIVLVWYVIQLLVTMFGSTDMLAITNGFGLIPFIVGIMTIIFVIVSYGYVKRLKEEKCKCSEAVGRTVLQILTWWYIVIWALVFVGLLIALLSALVVGLKM